MGHVVCPLRGHTTPRVSAIEMPTTDLGLLAPLCRRKLLAPFVVPWKTLENRVREG